MLQDVILHQKKNSIMDRNDIEEMAKDLIPQAEESNAGQVLMTADYDEKWEFIMGFRKKKKYRT